MSRRCVAPVLAVLFAAAPATAKPFQSEPHHVQLELPDDVELAATPVETGEGTTLVAAFRGPSLRAAITRVSAPNHRAWRKDVQFFKEVEDGLARSVPSYKRLRQRQHKLGKVPALDLDFRRQRGSSAEQVVARFLFFRTFTITLMVAIPAKASRLERKRVLELRETFKPYFKD